MSGTSLDGVDGVLAQFDTDAGFKVLGHAQQAMPSALRAEWLALNSLGSDELHRAALAANTLAHLQADVVRQLLSQTGRVAADIAAIGSHGQTVRHRPGEFDGVGYTLQVNQPALLAELSGITVISDFRSRDVAAGGQGAPLVPAFHAHAFRRKGVATAVLNLGGIANLSLLPADGDEPVRGFDCGPGNALLDHWVHRHLGHGFDEDGRWASGGRVDSALLGHLMSEPFLDAAPPKSTGRDLFNASWLANRLGAVAHQPLDPQDVQATLSEFTATAAADALKRHTSSDLADLLVCGGGALNGDLMRRLARQLPGVHVRSTAEAGLPPLQVEAAAFAWLAWSFLHHHPGNLPAVTGARGPRLLGACYPA